MLLKLLSLLALATALTAAPSKTKKTDDLAIAEGHHVSSYAAPPPAYGSHVSSYGAPAAPKHGGGAVVRSYNRRGHQASEYAKPSIYGSSYGAQPSIRSSSYSAGPAVHAPAHGYSNQALGHSAPIAYGGGYGPQTNAYSAHSQHLSHDPEYDPAKDPVSQYAAYVPVREYAPKSQSNGNELSIYGYRK